jgi:hypothetical protein
LPRRAVPFKEGVVEICEVVKGPVSVEVTAVDKDGMMKQGHGIRRME